MFQPKYYHFVLSSLLMALIVGCIFYQINYIENEGFCPTDDGVVLAQSFRILQGEIPHKDFISTKPVGSGILHSLHFFMPLPLEVSARWFVLIEFWCIAWTWVALFFMVFNFHFKNHVQFQVSYISAGLIAFTVNLNHFFLFPWTTIDGLFFSSIGFLFLVVSIRYNHNLGKSIFLATIAFLFISLSVLCRQSFVFFWFICLIYFCLIHFREKKYIRLVFTVITGNIPLIVYSIFLYQYDALGDFVSQLTGRSELFDTGILRISKQLIKSPFALLFTLALLYIGFKIGIQKRSKFKNKTLYEHPIIIKSLVIFSISYSLVLSFLMLILNDTMFQLFPFELFFILIIGSLFYISTKSVQPIEIVLLLFFILMCWSSLISLGVNTPVYLAGNIAVGVWIIGFQLSRKLITPKFYRILPLFLISLALLFFSIGIIFQRKYNYNDLPAEQLKSILISELKGLGEIKLNQQLTNYYSDLLSYYSRHPKMQNHCVFIPNNAILYPLLKTRNPLPVDWMQHDEYIGNEQKLYDRLNKLLESSTIYFVIDKIKISKPASSYELINYETKTDDDLFLKRYQVQKYDYLPNIKERCKRVYETTNFIVYQSTGIK